jgi:hypothetical protein
LVTCFRIANTRVIAIDALHMWRKSSLDQDDVFRLNFLENVFFTGAE